MKHELYKSKNNLFQSTDWLEFQKSYGRDLVNLADSTGVVLDLPLGKKAVWVQRGPNRTSNNEFLISNLPRSTVFIRIEPGEVGKKDTKSLGLKKVDKGALLSGQTSPKATQILDISKTEDETLAGMKPKTRYNIRLAEKKGVTVRGDGSVEEFYALLTKTASRDKGYSPHQKDYYQSLMDCLSSKGLVKIFIAEHEGEPLAGIMVSFYGDVATYLHGGFNDNKRNLMAPYLCQWAAIKEAKVKGCSYYDFWGVAETDDPGDPWAGITRFKEGFGGEKVVFAGGYDMVLNKFWYNLLTLAARMRHLIR